MAVGEQLFWGDDRLEEAAGRGGGGSGRRSRRRLAPLGAGRVRWLVDGMNVIGTRPDAWWRDRHAAMTRLVDMLERWAADERART